jgi:hypothetical protein
MPLLKCPQCGKEFTLRAAFRNHIKIHNSSIDKILYEIAEENDQEEQLRNIEKNDEESAQESGEEMTIIEDNQLESENEMNYEVQLDEEKMNNGDNYLNEDVHEEELVDDHEEELVHEDDEEKLSDIKEEELINADDNDDQVKFKFILPLVVQNRVYVNTLFYTIYNTIRKK